VPGHAGSRGVGTHQFIGGDRMEVVHGVNLRGRGVGPARAEVGHAPPDFTDHETHLLAQAIGAEVAIAHGALGIRRAAAARFRAARDHEGRPRIR
jgi:hypothetical protein